MELAHPRPRQDLMKPVHKQTANKLKEKLHPVLVGRLIGQATSSASTWLHEAFPSGKAVANATWHVEMRLRLLEPSPGAAQVAPSIACRHATSSGIICGKSLDDAGVHEGICGVGGFVEARHDRIRDWSAARAKDYLHCRVDTEHDVAPPVVKAAGRMDVVVARYGHNMFIDVVVASVATTNFREQARRSKEPGRSLRAADARKQSRYGSAVLPLSIEDTGRIGPGTMRFLKELAESQDLTPTGVEYRKLLAELQHVMLLGTAAILQSACGLTPTT